MSIVAKRCVYIVDDDSLVRQSIYSWLSGNGYDLRAFASPIDFLEDLENLEPGCALLDVRMPMIDGIQILEQHGARLQQMEVIMMTGHADVGMAVAAMKLGASDFIEKPFKPSTVITTVENALETLNVRMGEFHQANLAKSLIASLTQREREVLAKLSSGCPNKIIAYELDLSVRTVEMHRANIMKKLGVRSQAKLFSIAAQASSES